MDPNVKKILNNGGFIANLAPVLAFKAKSAAVSTAASELASAASIYSQLLAALGISPPAIESDWEGCDQAQNLIAWIRGPIAPDAPGLMTKWTAEIWDAIDALAHGKLPV